MGHSDRGSGGTFETEAPNRIREIRELRGLTQKDLAEETGLSANQIGHLERGERRLTFDYAVILAVGLDCAPPDLFAGSEGVSIPIEISVHATGRDNAPVHNDLQRPFRMIGPPPTLSRPHECFAAMVDDDSANRLYPPGSILIVRRRSALQGPLPIGAKVLVRRYRSTRKDHRSLEVLCGRLDRDVTGDVTLALRSLNHTLPAAVPLQRGMARAEILERHAEVLPETHALEYQPRDNDPAEILGQIVYAITPE